MRNHVGACMLCVLRRTSVPSFVACSGRQGLQDPVHTAQAHQCGVSRREGGGRARRKDWRHRGLHHPPGIKVRLKNLAAAVQAQIALLTKIVPFPPCSTADQHKCTKV